MTMVERRVRRLRIRASSEDRARHAAIVLEDALRTATIPGADGARLIVIRHLDVGHIAAAVSSVEVSLMVESVVRQLAGDAVHAESPLAATARVVWFQDETEALLALATRVARGPAPNEWFWPRVVRGWTPAASPRSTMTLLLERALAAPAGVIVAARLIEKLISVGTIDLLLEPITEHGGDALLAASGLTDDGSMAPLSSGLPALPGRAKEVLARWASRWSGGSGTVDRRATWLAAMLIVAQRPARSASASLGASARAVVASMVRSRLMRVAGEDTGTATDLPREKMSAGEMNWWEWQRAAVVDSAVGGGPPPAALPDTALAPESTTSPAPGNDQGAEDAEPDWRAPRATAFGGFLFVVTLLVQADLATLLAKRPHLVERDWPARLLRRIAARLGIPDDDAAVAWLPDDARILDDERAVSASALRAVRTQCRRTVGRSLARIVRRNGVITVTRTHVDLVMRYSQADVALRRAGLDIDPRWVPWLGKVVEFHYVDALPDVGT